MGIRIFYSQKFILYIIRELKFSIYINNNSGHIEIALNSMGNFNKIKIFEHIIFEDLFEAQLIMKTLERRA